MFSDHNGMELEINNRMRWKIHKYMEVKQETPINN